MTEATPGPWVHEGKAVYFLDWDGRSYEDGKPLMTNRWYCGFQGQTWVSGTGNPPRCSEAELEANARLAAKAPEMRDLLEIAATALWQEGKNAEARQIDKFLDELK